MADLGSLLALLHDGPPKVKTITAEIVRRTDQEVASAAWQAQAKGRGLVMFGYVDDEEEDDDPEQEDTPAGESHTRIWVDLEQRFEREETTGQHARIAVRRGTTWWSWDEYSGAVSNEEEDVGTSLADDRKWILGGLPLLGLLRLELLGDGEVCDRGTWRCRASRHPAADDEDRGHDWALHDLPGHGAEEYLIDVEKERGLVLRVAAVFEGAEFTVAEVTELAVNEPIDDDRFVFEAPDGSPVQSTSDVHGATHFNLSPSRLATLAGFALFAPPRVPEGWEATLGYSEPSTRPPQRAQAMIALRSSDNLRDIRITQTPADADGEYDEWDHAKPAPWQEHEQGGIVYQWRDPAEDWQPARVRFERDGTLMFIDSSHLTAAELLELATSLTPLRTESPDFSAGDADES